MRGNLYSRSKDMEKHSEEVRRRRPSQVGNSGLKRKAPSTTGGQPPVMARLESTGLPVRKHHASRTRRRFDLALSIPGAEIRLPSFPAVHFSWRIASAVLSLMMLYSFYLLWETPFFRIQVVEYEGLQRLTLNDVNMVLNLTDEPVIFVDPVQISQTLQQAFPELASIEVQVGLPASVKIIVEERQPLIVWSEAPGAESVWIDLEGTVFPARGTINEPLIEVYAESIPMMTADKDQTTLAQVDPVFITAVQAVRQFIPAEVALVYDTQRGFGWKDETGWQVYLGKNLVDIDQKLLVYKALSEHLQAAGVKPILISVEYVNSPYYRLEP